MRISDWSSDVCSSDLNIAVVAAAAGVFGTGTAWPDLIVALVLAGLGISGGCQIVMQAWGELRGASAASRKGDAAAARSAWLAPAIGYAPIPKMSAPSASSANRATT